MNSLSTSTLSQVVFSLGLLLVMATAFPTPTQLGEDSKDDATPNRPPLTSPHKAEELIKYILGKISELKKEICDKYGKCGKTPEALAENNLNLPTMSGKDGCFQLGFNQETCLMRITTGLLEFQNSLEYLKNFEGYKEKVDVVQMAIKALVEILKQKIKNPDKVTTPDPSADATLLTKQPQTDWLKNTTAHLILQSLEKFMESSLRAVRN
ncbi:interleukin-6 [Choloepus didactylus]|uniref:interleukin-6 n=1 Tax=Choloepus didactylus TaxID=27675 RepID=UPI00189D0855|nr:interleukin-6 [Choloepus didactylus]